MTGEEDRHLCRSTRGRELDSLSIRDIAVQASAGRDRHRTEFGGGKGGQRCNRGVAPTPTSNPVFVNVGYARSRNPMRDGGAAVASRPRVYMEQTCRFSTGKCRT